MPMIAIPSISDLRTSIVGHLDAALNQALPLLDKGYTFAFSTANAAAQAILYKYAGWVFLQQFARYASADEVSVLGESFRPLVEIGKLLGVGEPTPATQAELSITVAVTSVSSDYLPTGSQLLFPSTGVLYVTVEPVQMTASSITVIVRAASDQAGGGGSGTIGNLDAGEELRFANPLPNVSPVATVAAQLVTAVDAEEIEDYRTRVIRRAQQKPQGGAYADYRIWAESVSGIVAAFPYRGDTPGEIDVYIEASEASSGSADGIPTAGQITAVEDAIELDVNGKASRRPVSDAVNVIAITRSAFDVEVTGLSADDLSAAQATIEEAVDEYFRTREPYIVGLSVLPRKDRITAAAVSGAVGESVDAIGGSVVSVSMEKATLPLTAYTLEPGEKAKLGTITFV